ncbi:uncharacterized protein BJ212DRAFT_1351693, partial [Suillus subaureus]
ILVTLLYVSKRIPLVPCDHSGTRTVCAALSLSSIVQAVFIVFYRNSFERRLHDQGHYV